MSLQDIILKYVDVKPHPNQQGWYQTLCRVCNDHGKKGLRAGFRFDGDSVAYNCFNCGITASYHPAGILTDKMSKVLHAFDIPESELNQLILDNIGKDNKSKHINKYIDIIPPELPLPEFFYPLTDDKQDDWCQESIDYLTSRNVDWTSQPFFCVKQSSDQKFKRWYGRLIIPVYYDKKLIFYQGRDLTNLHVKKYLSPNASKQNVLYGYEKILQHTTEPLYVMEGWFDAVLIDGIALLGNKLTPAHIEWLNRTKRQKVIIPDKFGDGQLLAKSALKQGWAISTPDFADCKDVSAAVEKYGLLYTLKTISNNIVDGPLAEINLNIYCEK
jgi:hypothetical protein